MQKSATGNFHSGSPAVRPSRVSQVRATSREQNRPPVPGGHRPIFGLRGSHRSAPRPALMALEVCSSGTSRPIADVPLTAVDDPGCVKTLRGITAPGILGPMVMRRASLKIEPAFRKRLPPIRPAEFKDNAVGLV